MNVLLVKRHIACHNRVNLCEIMVSTTTVHEIFQFLKNKKKKKKKKKMEKSEFKYGPFTGVFSYFERTSS